MLHSFETLPTTSIIQELVAQYVDNVWGGGWCTNFSNVATASWRSHVVWSSEMRSLTASSNARVHATLLERSGLGAFHTARSAGVECAMAHLPKGDSHGTAVGACSTCCQS